MGIYKFDPEDAFRFARERGMKARKRGDELHFEYCPYCEQTTKDKETFSINLETGQFKCLRASCNAHGNMITLARDFGFSLGEETDEYYAPKRKYRNLSKYPVPETREPAIVYLASRGIPEEIVRKYHITTRKDDENVLVFPFYDDAGRMTFIKYRNTAFKKGESKGSKEWCEADCKPILFGMDQCNFENTTLVMTEGQIDSLSVASAGIENAVSVPNGANGFTWVRYCWDFLMRFKTIVIFGDHEHGHITLLKEMMSRKGPWQIKHVRPEDYKDCKDANELLERFGKVAVIDAVNHAVAPKHPLIKKLSEVQPLDLAHTQTVKTGIKSVDSMIGGFRFGQLIILTGKRGLGKSTFGSQMVVAAVNQGYTCFIYSGEMQSQDVQNWIDRQAAGPKDIRADVMEDTGYRQYMPLRSATDQIHAWYDERLYFYDIETLYLMLGNEEEVTDDTSVLSVMEEAIKRYECSVLLVDNLMIAIDDFAGNVDQYVQQTAFVKKLAFMARAYNVLIILVAHPRKSNDGSFDNDDVAGSANITNLADMVIQYAAPKDKDADYDRLIRVTKNRITGQLNMDGIPCWFEPMSKRISDDQNYGWKYGWDTGDRQIVLEGDEEVPDEIPF